MNHHATPQPHRPERPGYDSPGRSPGLKHQHNASPEGATYLGAAVRIAPLQGFDYRHRTGSQGCALGCRIMPFQGGRTNILGLVKLDRPDVLRGIDTATSSATDSASPRHALSLIEVVAATLIVGIMAVAALNSLGAATRSAESTGNRAVAQGLADALMTEILATAYSGLDTYHDRDEQLTGDRTGWRRQVVVETVNADNPIQTVGADQRAKRIRVTVEYDGDTLAEQIAIKTNHD